MLFIYLIQMLNKQLLYNFTIIVVILKKMQSDSCHFEGQSKKSYHLYT